MVYSKGNMWLENTDIFTEDDAMVYMNQQGFLVDKKDKDEPFFKFYFRNLKEHRDLVDIDRYAWLNTLFQYDIGWDRAMKIDSWLWGNETILKDYPLGFETLELDWNNEEDKQLLKKCDEECHLGLDFSKWLDHDVNSYMYF